MLGMAFFKSLVKEHGKQYFEPIGKALAAAGIKQPNPLNPAHAWALRGAVALREVAAGRRSSPEVGSARCRDAGALQAARGVRRGIRAESPRRSTARWASTSSSWRTGSAGWRSCRSGCRSGGRCCDGAVRRTAATTKRCATPRTGVPGPARQADGRAPSDGYFRAVAQLGDRIAEGRFQVLGWHAVGGNHDAIRLTWQSRVIRDIRVISGRLLLVSRLTINSGKADNRARFNAKNRCKVTPCQSSP